MDDLPAVACAATSELWRRDAHTGSAFVTSRLPQAHGALFTPRHIPSGCSDDRRRTRDYAGRSFCPRCGSPFSDARRRNRRETWDPWMPLTN